MSEAKQENSSGKTLLKSSSGMAFATLMSRILGLLRVRLESTVLGGGEVASGWFFAFAIPNLLRRVLGEGAIANALIPLIAEADVQYGREKVKKQLALVFLILGVILAAIVLVVSLGSWLILKYSSGWGIGFLEYPRIRLLFQLLIILMPYGFFICLVGIVGAVLNYAKIFLLPALAALLLNIVLLAVLSVAWFFAMSPEEFLPVLALSVPVSGILQLLLLSLWLWQAGYFPDFRNFWKEKDIISKLFKLALPGIIGYAALQFSFVIDQSMAASLNSQAIPALNYVNRIVDIPIGLVAVSFGAVLMSMMSRAAAEGKKEEIGRTLAFSLRTVWFVTLPLAVLIMFFHNNILQILCLGGKYTSSDLHAAHLVAIFYSLGIPFFCSLKVILPAFYARKKMVTVLVVSVCATVINIILNYILMQFFAQGGIALATVVASLVNNGALIWLLQRENLVCDVKNTSLTFVRSALVATAAGWGLYQVYCTWIRHWSMVHWSREIVTLAGIGVVFGVLYFAGCLLLKSPECREMVNLVQRRLK